MTDPYVIPGTNALINKLGFRDRSYLDIAEAEWSSKRTFEYVAQLENQGKAPRALDVELLKHIHRFLFQDVYPWAGEFRTVNIARTDPFVPTVQLESAGSKIFSDLNKRLDFLRSGKDSGVSKEEFLDVASEFLGHINALHPFREGNGRTQRLLIQTLGVELGYDVNWSQVTPRQMIDASIHSIRQDDSLLRDLLSRGVRPLSKPQERYRIFQPEEKKSLNPVQKNKDIERGPER